MAEDEGARLLVAGFALLVGAWLLVAGFTLLVGALLLVAGFALLVGALLLAAGFTLLVGALLLAAGFALLVGVLLPAVEEDSVSEVVSDSAADEVAFEEAAGIDEASVSSLFPQPAKASTRQAATDKPAASAIQRFMLVPPYS